MASVSLQTDMGCDHGLRRVPQLAVAAAPAGYVWLPDESGNTTYQVREELELCF
jgi:hypothetical protein